MVRASTDSMRESGVVFVHRRASEQNYRTRTPLRLGSTCPWELSCRCLNEQASESDTRLKLVHPVGQCPASPTVTGWTKPPTNESHSLSSPGERKGHHGKRRLRFGL
jgi:hypothetical protein